MLLVFLTCVHHDERFRECKKKMIKSFHFSQFTTVSHTAGNNLCVLYSGLISAVGSTGK